MASTNGLVWFITGVSSGIGAAIAIYALNRGQHVVGTVRSRDRATGMVKSIENKGGICLELDVTDADGAKETYQRAEALHGRVDVLVNNAGYSLLGATEDISEEESLAQFDTNFFGALRLIRVALPHMRARQSGTIVNIGSIAGIDGLPSCGLYAGSKFALEGMSESLLKEVARFNISVLLVEPGAFKTNLLFSMVKPATGHTPEYEEVEKVLQCFTDVRTQKGDPDKAAARIIEAVVGEGTGGALKGKALRLPLGEDCVQRMDAKIENLIADLRMSREIALSTDFDTD